MHNNPEEQINEWINFIGGSILLSVVIVACAYLGG
jgi:hypothetical protein